MPLIDAKLMLADGFDASAIANGANANLTNVIDFGAGEKEFPPGGADVLPDVGAGGDMEVNVICTEAFASAGTPTGTLTILASAAENLGTPDTLKTITFDKTVALGDILAKFKIPAWPIGKRYFGGNLAIGGTGDFSAGKISAWVDMGGLR